jgi:L-Ala-D/L-Glu epimerase
MKITDIETIWVSIPYKHSIVSSFRGLQEGVETVLVRVHTDEGITGIGEVIGCPPFNDVADTMIQRQIKPVLVGEDPLRVEHCTRRMEAVTTFWVPSGAFAVSAVEIALWDIKGKALGAPVFQLLGGAVKERVPVSGYVFIDTPEENVKLVEYYKTLGVPGVKVKVGRDPQMDIDRVAAIRECLGPDGIIRVDADEAWSPKKAIQVVKALMPYGLALVEQPVPLHDYEGLKLVRESVDVPVAPDDSLWGMQEALRHIKMGTCDAFVIRPEETGGLKAFHEVAAVARAAGIACACGSWGSSGVLLVARLHATASCSNIVYPNDTHYYFLADDVLAGGMLEISDGAITVPTGPGLGIALDEDKIQSFAKRSGEVRTNRWQSGDYLPAAPRHWF